MDKRIKLLKNNDNKDWTDLQWIEEFYDFMQGESPASINSGKPLVKISKKNAFSIIWYLQEHLPILPDNIEKCSECGDLYDCNKSGYHAEYNGKFYCDVCCPDFIDEKDERIMKKRK